MASKRFEGQATTGQEPYADDYFFYRYDVRGSVTTIVDGEGAVVKSYDYDEFGVTTSTGDTFFNEVTFTGGIADASDLLYMNARYYNPPTARFLCFWAITAHGYQIIKAAILRFIRILKLTCRLAHRKVCLGIIGTAKRAI